MYQPNQQHSKVEKTNILKMLESLNCPQTTDKIMVHHIHHQILGHGWAWLTPKQLENLFDTF